VADVVEDDGGEAGAQDWEHRCGGWRRWVIKHQPFQLSRGGVLSMFVRSRRDDGALKESSSGRRPKASVKARSRARYLSSEAWK
jgi:hypothetical protein